MTKQAYPEREWLENLDDATLPESIRLYLGRNDHGDCYAGVPDTLVYVTMLRRELAEGSLSPRLKSGVFDEQVKVLRVALERVQQEAADPFAF